MGEVIGIVSAKYDHHRRTRGLGSPSPSSANVIITQLISNGHVTGSRCWASPSAPLPVPRAILQDGGRRICQHVTTGSAAEKAESGRRIINKPAIRSDLNGERVLKGGDGRPSRPVSGRPRITDVRQQAGPGEDAVEGHRCRRAGRHGKGSLKPPNQNQPPSRRRTINRRCRHVFAPVKI